MLVPINKKYPLKELLDACRAYPSLSNSKRITFEYVMLRGVNDSLADAKELVRMLKGIPAKINLIPFNPWPGVNYQCSEWEQIEKFADYVNNAGYASPIRTPRGRDILAACGQLKSESERMKKTERLAFEAAMIITFYIFRFALIVFGFVCATFAASLFLNLLWLGSSEAIGSEGPFLYSTVPIFATMIGYSVFITACILILFAELTAWRDLLFYALGG
eukprot:gene27791-33603_t